MNILYVGNTTTKISSGYDRLNQRNMDMLCSLPSIHVDVVEFFRSRSILDLLTLRIGGMSHRLIYGVRHRLEQCRNDFVFLSSSLLGELAEKIKEEYPEIKIICNFHNIERHYAYEFLKVSGWKHLPFFLAAKRAEKKAVDNMDYSLVLNDRDAFLLWKIYNRNADLILPIAQKDIFVRNEFKEDVILLPKDIIYLFVGVSFFANIEGLRWFISKILPHIPGKLMIVGKGMEILKRDFSSDRIEIHGFVESLSSYYEKATVVIAPILSGGGMKTKIAEALMFGKRVIGTKEAFEGYIVDGDSLIQCDTCVDFINCVRDMASHMPLNNFNNKSRQLYLEHYSINGILKHFNESIWKWMKS